MAAGALLGVAAFLAPLGCGDRASLTRPDAPPKVDLSTLPAQNALTGEAYALDLSPYVTDDWDDVADLTFTVISLSNQDVKGGFTGSSYGNTFTIVGEVTVNFSVADTSGLVSIASLRIGVVRGPLASDIYPSVARLDVRPRMPFVGNKVTLDASASYDPDGSPLAYTWDYDDDFSTVDDTTSVITYARSPDWTVADVASGSFDWLDLVVDASGTAHIAFIDIDDDTTRYLAGYDDGTGWTTTIALEDVATTPDDFHPLLSIDGGRARAYGIDDASLVMYERDADDAWTRFALDRNVQAGMPAIVAGTCNDALGGDQLVYWHDGGGSWLLRHVVGPIGRRP